MIGTIKYFSSEKQFGFVEAEDGREFYFRSSSVVGRVHFVEGTRVRFDSAKYDETWTQRLNEGTLRDMGGVNHRNPRPPRRPNVRPVVTNVALLEERSS